MNICHINVAKSFRGGERQSLLLMSELAALGQQQRVILRAGLPVEQKARAAGLNTVAVKHPLLARKRWFSGIDLIHAHEAKGAWLAHLAHRRFGIPYVLTRRVMKKPGDHYLNRQTLSRASQVVAISSAVERAVSGFTDRIIRIPSCYASLEVNPTTLSEIKQRYQGKFLIGNVGALENVDKGQIHLLNIARQLKERIPNVHIIFLGTGSDREWFLQRSADLPHVEFLGFQQDVGSYLAALDLFVFPSLREGLGSSLLDVIQAGVPIVASDTGGIPDIIQHEHNGLLTPPGDEPALLTAITRLAATPELGAQLADTALAGLERFSPKVSAKMHIELYQSIVRE